MFRGIKRLICGYTSHFNVWKDSCALAGKSFESILSRRVEYPTTICAIEFLMEKDCKAMYRIMVDGIKVFPFNEENKVENDLNRQLIPVKIAAGSYLQIEVRGIDPDQKNVVILNELDVIEKY